ncbi:hypothetical protein NESM_000779000 [Novymonas esmeraldas]|uniref:Uncharacterized protein n=1 Tax=Novymonas esmeraldas TaxID=1808958 RepID=A0AAW0EVD3_9TRYP
MSTYFFRFPTTRTCVVGGGAVFVLVGCSSIWGVGQSRRNAVPVFNSAAVVRTEESARYRCEALEGFDVVVRSYYVPTTDDQTSASPRSSLSARWGRFAGLFFNDTHRVDTAEAAAATEADASSVRLVVRDARDTRDTQGIAASRWPAGTAKYAALVLEPSSASPSPSPSPSSALSSSDVGARPPAAARSLLRQLADGATHQSLSRCNPRSTLLDMACEGDPAYLGAPYLRVLLSGLLLLPSSPSRLNVAVLGVGGGSLPLFLQRYFGPRLHRCDLVDVEPMCVKAAVEQLGLKEMLNTVELRSEGGGVHFHVEDAVHYLRHRVGSPSAVAGADVSGAHHGTVVFPTHPDTGAPASLATSTRRQRQLDVLFVDLFVGSELDSAVTSLDFLRLCRGALSSHGVAAFNLPAADREFVQRCAAVFGAANVYRIPVPASSNEVVLARGGADGACCIPADGLRLSHRHLYRRAQELTAQYRLPYDLANHYPVWWRLW